LQHIRFDRAKAQIARLIVPERVALMNTPIEQLAKQSLEYVSEQVLELYVPDGATSPLRDTPAAPWSQYREQTLKILFSAVEGALQKAKELLVTVEAKKGFTRPEIASRTHAAVEPKETELVEA
jgi:hypothetical protein